MAINGIDSMMVFFGHHAGGLSFQEIFKSSPRPTNILQVDLPLSSDKFPGKYGKQNLLSKLLYLPQKCPLMCQETCLLKVLFDLLLHRKKSIYLRV